MYIMEFYSAIRKIEIIAHTEKCMEVEIIALSEISQMQKEKKKHDCPSPRSYQLWTAPRE